MCVTLTLWHLLSSPQLDEANSLLRTELDAAARLRKSQTELSKQLQQLESNGRELQDKCCMLENGKLKLEKDYISLQAALEAEKRDCSQGSETITDLQGACVHVCVRSPYPYWCLLCFSPLSLVSFHFVTVPRAGDTYTVSLAKVYFR